MHNGTEDLISLFTSLGCMRILSFASSGQIALRSTSSMGALSPASLDQGWTELEQPLQLLMLHMCGINYNDPAGQGSKNEARFESWRDDRPSIYMQHLRDHDLWPETEAPVFSIHGGNVAQGSTVTLSNPNAGGTLYYTTSV